METVFALLQAIHLNMVEVFALGIVLFFIGYKLGNKKVKQLTQEIYGLQREVLDLNAELLTGKEDIKTPVIEIKHDPLKSSKLAK
jgi:hypothetical protein